jgi:glycosyltransferase involved in cell wall biosynthesis
MTSICGCNELVSVIIPTFNSAKFISVCLESVTVQKYPHIETFVVDNYSDDGTAKLAEAFGANVFLFNGTQAAARNVGIAKSRGNYVLFLDSDQCLDNGVLEDCISICASTGVEAVKIPEFFVGLCFWGKCSALWKNNMVNDFDAESAIPRFYKKEKLLEQGAFVEDLWWWEDQELYQRLKSSGLKENWCTRRVVHYEVDSPRNTARKYLSYGRSASSLRRINAQGSFDLAFKLTFSSIIRVIKYSRVSPSIFLGCLFLFAVRSLSGVVGFFSGLVS